MSSNPDVFISEKDYDFDTRRCDTQCRPLAQNRSVGRLQIRRLQGLCSNISSSGSLEKNSPADVCMYACVSKQFRLWNLTSGQIGMG